MDTDKLQPSHRLLALRSGGNAMPLEDVSHCLIADRIAQVGQSTHDTVITPRAVLTGHPDHQVLDLFVNAGTTNRFPWRRESNFSVGELTVPGEDRVRLGNSGDFFQSLLPQLGTKLCKFFAFAVGALHATIDLMAQDAILCYQVVVTESKMVVQ
jgi:hypothetical protein